MRTFETSATRDDCDDKYDFEGFYHPSVIEAFGRYMHHHRKQADGELRDSDNWQNGIPKPEYMKSLWRHFLDLCFLHRGIKRYDVHGDGHELTVEEVCCAILFNVQGYLFEELREAERDLPMYSEYVEATERIAPFTEPKNLTLTFTTVNPLAVRLLTDSAGDAMRTCTNCARTKHDSVCHACGYTDDRGFWTPIKTGGTD